MNTKVFIIGSNLIPTCLKKDKTLNCQIIDRPYALRESLQSTTGEKIVVAFLSFLEVRHFDIYTFLQKSIPNVKTIFVVSELSLSMKIKLKANNEFIVLWKTEEANLTRDIHAYLDGKQLKLRQDRREAHEKKGLLIPSTLPPGQKNRCFQPILGGSFENISLNGYCLKIKANYYGKKDFVNLTYQTKEGEYITVEGQIRWTKWNESEQCQELGIQLLAQI